MRLKKFISLALALTLVLSLSVPAAYADGEVLHISTAEELSELAVNCAEDDYSVDLEVVLDADIDLKDVEFYPIPSFSGVFDGAGHSILNMKTATNGSHQGFFRYVQEGGIVKNLRVEGSITPEGSKNQLGGIAGVNRGTIENCSFKGFVKGLTNVGGIAGENYGNINNCMSEGTAEGKRSTGGIAGKNEGSISGCTGNVRVNTSISQEKKELEELSLADITNLDLKNANDEDTVTDSGGIAGYSTGYIGECINEGTIGYKHYGYNVGGIAGRQCGYIFACENRGVILGRKDVGGIVGQMEPFMILTDSANLPGEISALQGMIAGTMGNVGTISNQFASAFDDVASGSSGGISSAPEGGISGDGGNGGSWGDNGYGQAAGSLVNSIGDSTGTMAQGLVGVSNQLARVLIILANTVSGADRAVVVDISEKLPEDDVDGRIKACVNMGQIDADKNVGGIAGEMGIEYEFDLEGTLAEFFGMGGVLSATYQTKCVNDSNVNKGSINAKKENVGGIVGMEKLGTVINCEGYGSVKSEEGGCVGGIAGRSESSVRDCYAMCNIDGSANIGGIAGYGTIISGCGSLVGISNLTAPCCGAIAGWADIGNTETIFDNIYVHKTIGAVDGISYAGQAEKMSYDNFLQLEGLPEQFRRLKLSFTAEGKTVKDIEFTYGGSVDESHIPEVPEKEGYTGRWPDYDYSTLYFSDTIEAVYTPRQAAIATRELRADTPMSIVLLEGDFGDSAILSLNEYDGDGPELQTGMVLEKWIMSIDDPNNKILEKYTVRFAPPESDGRIIIQVFDGENWKPVSTGENGSYLTFEGSGDEIIFCAVETEKNNAVFFIILIAALALLAVIAFFIVKARKRKADGIKEALEVKDSDGESSAKHEEKDDSAKNPEEK